MVQDVTVTVYDSTGGGVPLATLERVWGVQWKDELNGPGVGQFTIHGADAQATQALLKDRNIVKFSYAGADRFAMVIRGRRRVHVSQQEQAGELITVSGPGVASMLTAGVVFPEYGTLRRSGDSRAFSYGSRQSEWYIASEWAAPVASAASSDIRTPQIVGWPAESMSASWIWPTDGTLNVPLGSIAFFRREFTLTAEMAVVLFTTGDDGMELKLDGETIIPIASVESRSWKVTKRFETVLSAGVHLLAGRVNNNTVFDSPAGLLLALHQLDVDGEPVEPPVLVTDTTWLSRPGPSVPGWSKANVIRKLIIENRDTYGVESLTSMALGILSATDANGQPWEGNVDSDRSFPVGTSLLEVLTQLSEAGGFDWHAAPDMILRAYKSRGAVRSVALQKAVNLLGHETTSTSLRATRLLTRTRHGWLDVSNDPAEAASGTHYDFLSLGEVEDDVTALAISRTALATYAYPQTAHTTEVAVLPGAVPYVDYGVGDRVQGPSEWGGQVQLKIRALTMTMDRDGRMRPVPEFLPV